MSDSKIKEAIWELSGTRFSNDVDLIVATIESVDISTRSCTVTTTSSKAQVTIESVLLMATIDDGVLLIPTKGSTVFVSKSKHVTPFVVAYSQIDSIILIGGDAGINITGNIVKLNDGSYGGLVKITDLITKMNNLENLINHLIGLYNTHIHPVSGSTTLVTTMIETETITPTLQAELENINVTHGKEL